MTAGGAGCLASLHLEVAKGGPAEERGWVRLGGPLIRSAAVQYEPQAAVLLCDEEDGHAFAPMTDDPEAASR
eukprot:967033-Pyramimonas_sp.AAC.1